MTDKIKIVWICHFVNEIVNNKIELKFSFAEKLLRCFLHKQLKPDNPADFGIWNTNAIKEFEKIQDVELHVISPYPYLGSKKKEFLLNNIYYHLFTSEDKTLYNFFLSKIKKYKFVNYNPFKFLFKRIYKNIDINFCKNRKIISTIISKIKPDIVNLIGAENPYYSLALLDIPENIPTIVQLQTLMSDPDFLNNYPISKDSYKFRANIERQILKKANYIGTNSKKFRNIIIKNINDKTIFVNTRLALTETINVTIDKNNKKYDFVYFSLNINKAADLALEAFGIAYSKDPSITLDIIGSCDLDYKQKLDCIIEYYNMKNAITFEGKLQTHEDVINQIRKARFALLPLKVDLTSGTVREAMANGLPVLTTDTGVLGTQKLNLVRQNVLISAIGDHQALADNMLKLMTDEGLVESLCKNAYQTTLERKSNEEVIRKNVEIYRACINNFKYNIQLPKEFSEI